MLAANLILEGVPGIGKSAIAANLLPYDTFIFTKPTSIENTYYKLTNYFGRLSGTFRDTGTPWVIDGGHLSEMVHGTLYRPQHYRDGMLKRWIRQSEEHLIGSIELYTTVRPAIIVYLEPIDLFFSQDSNATICMLAMYEVMLRKTRLPVVRIKRSSKHSIDETIEMIMEKVNERS